MKVVNNRKNSKNGGDGEYYWQHVERVVFEDPGSNQHRTPLSDLSKLGRDLSELTAGSESSHSVIRSTLGIVRSAEEELV